MKTTILTIALLLTTIASAQEVIKTKRFNPSYVAPPAIQVKLTTTFTITETEFTMTIDGMDDVYSISKREGDYIYLEVRYGIERRVLASTLNGKSAVIMWRKDLWANEITKDFYY